MQARPSRFAPTDQRAPVAAAAAAARAAASRRTASQRRQSLGTEKSIATASARARASGRSPADGTHGGARRRPPAGASRGPVLARLEPLPSAASATAAAEGPLEDVMAKNRAAMDALRDGQVHVGRQLLTEALMSAEAQLQALNELLARAGDSAERTGATRKAAPVGKAARAAVQTLKQRQEGWLLSYAVTLSNLGCALRRVGETERALVCLRDASEVEARLCGRPSCSTMLNLSAVLLGLGEATEALPIAKDCVTAAQDGDRTLFITALHNLAMTLGQQSSARERSAALPTMLRALREAQEFLGNDHPTTVMLRTRCSTAHDWIDSVREHSRPPSAGGDTGEGGASPDDRGVSSLRSPSPPFPVDLHNASEPNASVPSVHSPEGSLRSTGAGSARPHSRYGKKPPVNLIPLSPGAVAGTPEPGRHTGCTGAQQTSLHGGADYPQVAARQGAVSGAAANRPPSERALQEEAVVRAGPYDDPGVDQLARTSVYAEDATELPAACREEGTADAVSHTGEAAGAADGRDENHSAPRETSRADSAESHRSLMAVVTRERRESVELPPAVSTRSSCPTELEAALSAVVVAAPSTAERTQVANLSAVPATRGVNIYAAQQPSFLRFAAAGALSADAQPPMLDGASAKNSLLTYQRIRQTLRRAPPHEQLLPPKQQQRQRPCAPTAVSPPQEEAAVLELDTASAGGCSSKDASQTASARTATSGAAAALTDTTPLPPGTLTAASATTAAEERSARRAARLAWERREEEAFRSRQARRETEQKAEMAFNAALRAIVDRTRERAAHTIQALWRRWWGAVGKPRHDASVRRAQERERRLQERLIVLTDTAQADARRRRLENERAVNGLRGSFAAPAVVVECGRQWLAHTECVRYLARHGFLRGEGLQRHTEAKMRKGIVQLQARCRGFCTRKWYAVYRAERARTEAPAKTHTHDLETRAYAAVIVQKAFRSALARQERSRRLADHQAPAALAIQRWFRRTWASQCARGVDSTTVAGRHRAARLIQTVWRAHAARLRCYVARVRRQITALRQQEQHSVSASAPRLGLTDGQKELHTNASPKPPAAAPRALGAAPKTGSHTPSGNEPASCPPPPSAYEQSCHARASAVYREQEADYDAYDVPLHWNQMAERERQERIRTHGLKPSDVARRRAGEHLLREKDLYAVRRERAACRIQRAFRSWLRHSKDAARDKGLLFSSRLQYQQKEVARQRARHAQLQALERAASLHGDQSRPVREALIDARAQLQQAEGFAQTDPSSGALTVQQNGSLVDGANSFPRSLAERREAERRLQQDERHVRANYPRELARLRGDVYHTGYGSEAALD